MFSCLLQPVVKNNPKSCQQDAFQIRPWSGGWIINTNSQHQTINILRIDIKSHRIDPNPKITDEFN